MAGVELLGSPKSLLARSSNFSGLGEKTCVVPLWLVTNSLPPARFQLNCPRDTLAGVGRQFRLEVHQIAVVVELDLPQIGQDRQVVALADLVQVALRAFDLHHL